MRKRLVLSLLLIAALVLTAVYYLGPRIFADIVYPLRYPELVQKYAKEYGVDACLVQSIIEIESRGNPRATSHAGAQGLMQLMPGTFRSVQSKIGLAGGNAYDPETNIRAGTWLIKYNLNNYGSLRNLAVAYNAGGARVKLPDSQLPRETRNYIGKLNTAYSAYKASHAGFCTASTASAAPTSKAPPAPDFPDFVAPEQATTPNYLNPDQFWKSLFVN